MGLEYNILEKQTQKCLQKLFLQLQNLQTKHVWALKKLQELGIKKVTMPSAGNAAGAMAAYAAAGNLEAHVVMPNDAPIMIQKE